MSRITKEIASIVATELITPKVKIMNDVKNQLKTLVRGYYIDSLPGGLLAQYKKYGEWFSTTASVRLVGEGISQGYKYYGLGEILPQNKGVLHLDERQSLAVVLIENEIETKEREINILRTNIEAAIYNLRIYSNVEKEFPEAFKLLPASKVNTGLMVNIKDIRCQLDKSNCA